jgi:hypothetical protein
MYDEIVKRLRELHPEEFGDAWDFAFACQQAMCEAADAIKELSMKLHGDEAAIAGMKREIERMVVAGNPRWIPVSERLPSAHELVLVYNPGYLMSTGFMYEDGRWRVRSVDYPETPTHWMPLPSTEGLNET